MATIQVSSTLNMHTLTDWFGTFGIVNSAEIQIINGPLVGTYSGGFTYDNSGDVFGTLTGFTETLSGVLQLSVTGIGVSANTAEQLVQSNQLQSLFQIALSGNDNFIVAPGTHVIDGYGGVNTVTEPFARTNYAISNSGSSVLVTSAVSQDTLFNIGVIDFSDGVYNTQSGVFVPNASSAGILGSLTTSQQLELVYIAYFDRAADGGGFTFWGGQNVQTQKAGQSASTSLTSIANAFAPQPETDALYPFLVNNSSNLTTPAAQSGAAMLIANVYQNLFGHAPDAAGAAYWLGQITSGAVGLGAAILAIANGAIGSDAIELQNKIAVALDFTSRTSAAGLGTTSVPTNLLSAAKSVLTGVDGTSLNDASVTAGEARTTAFLGTGSIGHQVARAAIGNAAAAAAPTTGVSASAGLNPPALAFISSPDVTLGNGAAILDYALSNTSGVATIAGFQYGLDQLNLDLMGAPDSVLQAFDTNVAGSHAIAITSSAAPADGVVLLNLPASDTAADLLAQHLSFAGGHALIG
jgi:hypothetical protein